MIRALGAYGGKGKNKSTTSLQIAKDIVIDAGNIFGGLGDDAEYIDHILLTHSHMDHIADIPFLIDAYFDLRYKPLKIYGLKETIDSLKKNILNWEIWPDFSAIKLLHADTMAIEFIEITPYEEFCINDIHIKSIPVNHIVPCIGYVIKRSDESSLLFTSDTYTCDTIWSELNNNTSIDSIVIDVAFPSRLSQVAKSSKHLTPTLLSEELKKLKRDNVVIYINHLKPNVVDEITEEIKELGILDNGGKILKDGDILLECKK
jgi:phosphoribosyl 1,2-cyclic phosphodiesterase